MSRLLLTHETNTLPNVETSIVERPRRLRLAKGCRSGERYDSTVELPLDSRKGLGGKRQRELVVLQPNGNSYILGRSTRQTEVLPRYVSTTASGPDTPLFTHAQFDELIQVYSNRCATNPMVIITQKSKHEKLVEALSHLNCRRVVNFMVYTFDGMEHIVVFAGEVTTIGNLLHEYPAIADAPAKNCYIKFWGGPPDQVGFFYGTVLTVLCDAIMQTTCDGNMAIYQRFLNLQKNEEELLSTS